MKKLLILLVVLAFFGSKSRGQNGQSSLFFEHVGERDGIPQGRVTSLAEDASGFLWFAVQGRGLFRFDGATLRVFDRENSALPSLFINQLLDDGAGRLWAATNDGLACIRLEDLQISTFKKGGVFRSLGLDAPRRRLLAGSDGSGLFEWSFERSDSLRHLPIERIVEEPTGRIRTASLDFLDDFEVAPDGQIWAVGGEYGTEKELAKGLFELDEMARTARWWPQNGGKQPFFNVKMHKIKLHEPSRSFVLLDHDGLVRRFFLDEKRWASFPLGAGKAAFSINDFEILNDREAWLLTSAGLKTLDLERGKIDDFSPPEHPKRQHGPPSGDLFSIVLARDGTRWLAGADGLSKLVPLHQQFPERQLFGPNFFPQATAQRVATGEVFGFRVAEKGRIEAVSAASKNGKSRRWSLVVPALAASPNAKVRTAFASKKGPIWLGLTKGMARFDAEKGQLEWFDRAIETQNGVPARTADFWFERFFEAQNGLLLACSWGAGLLEIDEKSLVRQQAIDLRGSGQPLFNLALSDAFEDEKGRLWLAYQGSGLAVFLPDQKRLLRLLDAAGQPVGGGFARQILPDRAGGRLWFLTLDGLFFWRERGGSNGDFRLEKALAARVEGGFLAPDGQIWLRTEGGLVRFDPATGRSRLFGERDGLAVAFGSEPPLTPLADGRVLVGGHWLFRPDSILIDDRPPRVFFAGFRINEKAAPFSDRLQTLAEAVLRPGDDLFSVDFLALDFAAPAGLRFAYKLDGVDRDWVDCGSRRFASFSHLEGGSYLFRLRATSADGLQSAEKTLKIRVVPPFWRTVWFAFFCAGAFVVAVFSIFRYREKQLLEREKIRLRIARDLHDDVGSSLSSIQILSEIVRNSPPGAAQDERLRQIGEKSREALANVSDLVWGIQPQNDGTAQLVERMQNFAFETLAAAGIELDFRVEKGFEAVDLAPEKRKEWYFIFKEAINNAAKYSRARRVEVRLFLTEKRPAMAIRDDGEGMDLNEKGEGRKSWRGGNGLGNMAARAEAIGADFSISSRVGAGVELVLKTR